MTTTIPDLLPVRFDAPLAEPTPHGLYAATTWHDDEVPRWLASGVDIRTHNYGGDSAFGIWGAGWCGDPDDLKTGTRPEDPDAFEPLTAWSYDACDLTAGSRAEVRSRVQQTFRLVEQTAIEREFAARLLLDVTPVAVTTIVEAVSQIEAAFAKTNTVGFIHASAEWAAVADAAHLIKTSGGGLTSPLGHRWVFGGGYVDGLGATLVGTSPTFGWRTDVEVRDAIAHLENKFVAVAERSVVVGYERAVAAATIA